MKNGERKQVGNAVISKVVSRGSVAVRDSAGTKIGRRCFSSVAYIVKRANGSIIDVVRTERAAVKLAESV